MKLGILVFRFSSVSLYVSWFQRHSQFTQKFAFRVENNASDGFELPRLYVYAEEMINENESIVVWKF